jgi:hypothetical protein
MMGEVEIEVVLDNKWEALMRRRTKGQMKLQVVVSGMKSGKMGGRREVLIKEGNRGLSAEWCLLSGCD